LFWKNKKAELQLFSDERNIK